MQSPELGPCARDKGNAMLPREPPTPVDTGRDEGARSRKPRLNQAGRLLLIVAFAAGLAVFVWAGWFAGMIVGLERGALVMEKPRPPGIGLAPNLGGILDGAAELGAALVVGVGGGLLAGSVIMWAGCRFLLAPLLRAVPGLTRAER